MTPGGEVYFASERAGCINERAAALRLHSAPARAVIAARLDPTFSSKRPPSGASIPLLSIRSSSLRERNDMPGDPNTRYEDGWFVATQPYEYRRFKQEIRDAAPGSTEAEIVAAILACRKLTAPSKGSTYLKAQVCERLKVLSLRPRIDDDGVVFPA